MKSPPLYKLVPEDIRDFEPYIPSKPDDELKKLYGCSDLYRLNNNENRLGPPAAALNVLKDLSAEDASLYPSGDSFYLKNDLAERFGIHPDQIIVGNGANEIISFVMKAFCREGDNIITADQTYAVYEWLASFAGVEYRLVPLRDFGFDDEGILQRIDENSKVIFICNPNNPTGSYWNESRMRRFLDRVGGEKIVVLDEAYGEFVDNEDYPDGMSLIKEYPNVVVFRTFSKMYGMAGLRIGYLAGDPAVVGMIRNTTVSYSVNYVAQRAARAALADEDHIRKTRAMVKEGKAYLSEALNALELPFISGEGNFVMIKLPMSDSLAYRKLMQKGFMVRSMTSFRFPNYIRVTIDKIEVMKAFIEALSGILPEDGESVKR